MVAELRAPRPSQHRNGKKHVWQQEKNALQRGEVVSAAGKKRQQKNAASQREKFKAAEKTPCSSTKAPLQQKKCILEAAGKNRPRREKTRPRQEKNRPRQEKNQQQRKSSFATQKVAATEKIHFRNGKKQQPCRTRRHKVIPYFHRITRHEAAEVQGHLNFAQGFFTSKSLRFVLSQFDALSKVQGAGAAKKLTMLCEITEHTLTALPPRKFSACAMQKPFLLFTDGAWENSCATAGLLIYNPDSRELVIPSS